MYYTSFHFYRIKKDSAPAFGMKTSSNTLKKKLKLVANSAGAVSILFTVRFMSFHLGNNNDNRDYKFSKLATKLFYSNGFILILQAKLGNSNNKIIACHIYIWCNTQTCTVKIKDLLHWFLLQQI